MNHKKVKKYYLYWIYRECHTDITEEGYIGITNNYRKRWDKHRSEAKNGCEFHLHRAIRKYSDIKYKIICIGSKKYILNLEKELRPKRNIGWNMVAGGENPSSYKVPEEFYIKKAGEQSILSIDQSIEVLNMYFIKNISRQKISDYYHVSKGVIDRIIDLKGKLPKIIVDHRNKLKTKYKNNISRPSTITEEFYDSILSKKELGYTAQEVAEFFQISPDAVTRYCLGKPNFVKEFSCFRIVNSNKPKKYFCNGLNLTIKEWSKILKITEVSLNLRLRSGWSIEKTFTTPGRFN